STMRLGIAYVASPCNWACGATTLSIVLSPQAPIMATPSYRPVTPRKLDTIFSASIAGVVVGALLTAVSAAIMYKRDLTP
ncbi:MAG TPA: hypothetical protein VIH35_06245, partial [Kiritimatiellia bacterium]